MVSLSRTARTVRLSSSIEIVKDFCFNGVRYELTNKKLQSTFPIPRCITCYKTTILTFTLPNPPKQAN